MPNRLTMPMGEAMYTQRAIRRLKPDPISDEDIKTLIDAAQKAPNGGNQQPARFLVLKDREIIKKFGALYHEAWWAKRKDQGWNGPEDIPKDNKTMQSAMRLADEIKDAPLIVLGCSLRPGMENSVFPPIQNLMLAARCLGIGSTFTTLHPTVMERVHDLLGIPKDISVLCCIPLGYPRGNFGPTVRKASSEVTYYDRWEGTPPW